MLRRARERQEEERIERETPKPTGKRQQKAADLWSKANPHPDPNHAYLAREGGLPPVGIRQIGDARWFPSMARTRR